MPTDGPTRSTFLRRSAFALVRHDGVDTRFDGVVTVISRRSVNAKTGWAVLEVCDSDGCTFRAVGDLARFMAPDRLRIAGAWQQHPRWGEQLRARSIVLLPAFGTSDAVATLTRVPNVGAKRARLLVDRFGPEHVYAKIDQSPSRVFQLSGMSLIQAGQAARWWRQHSRPTRTGRV